jgi:uncharacterized membrane protein
MTIVLEVLLLLGVVLVGVIYYLDHKKRDNLTPRYQKYSTVLLVAVFGLFFLNKYLATDVNVVRIANLAIICFGTSLVLRYYQTFYRQKKG